MTYVTTGYHISEAHLLDHPSHELPSEDRAVSTLPIGQPTVQMHAAQRWASVIVAAARSERDPKTLTAWGRAVGAGCGTIRAWCRAARTSPRSSLYFCRMLRALVVSQSEGWEPQNLLDIVDERTVKTFFDRCGVSRSTSSAPTIEAFIATQQLISDPKNLNAVVDALLVQGFNVGVSTAGRLQTPDKHVNRNTHNPTGYESTSWWIKRGA